MITAPKESQETDFHISANYYLTLTVRGDKLTVSFPLCSPGTLYSISFEGFIVEADLPGAPWFGYSASLEGTMVVVPPDRPGFFIRKEGASIPDSGKASSKIFWKIHHDVEKMKTPWSEHPVFFSRVGNSFPAVAFLSNGDGIYAGIGDTPDRALLNAVHLSRAGYRILVGECSDLTSGLPDSEYGSALKENLLMNQFLSNSRCIDREENCIMASKSPEYYVSTGFWARDFVFWSLPGIEMLDMHRAGELIATFISKYSRNRGIHALYMDGRILYDGFELDEYAAYITAVSRALHLGIIGKGETKTVTKTIMKDLSAHRSDRATLFSTELNSSDDPVKYQYVTYSNVRLWKSIVDLSAEMDGKERDILLQLADDLMEAIQTELVDRSANMYCYSSDLKGNFEMYDDPTGSLLLLPFLGFSGYDDTTYRNTVDWILSGRNSFRFDGKYGGNGNRHVKHPWAHYFASLLLAGRREGLTVLSSGIINSLACETIDEDNGKPLTGIHFPGAAGFLAQALLKYSGTDGTEGQQKQD